jgi:hypothetical protein
MKKYTILKVERAQESSRLKIEVALNQRALQTQNVPSQRKCFVCKKANEKICSHSTQRALIRRYVVGDVPTEVDNSTGSYSFPDLLLRLG